MLTGPLASLHSANPRATMEAFQGVELKVSGNSIIDQHGTPVSLVGVNYGDLPDGTPQFNNGNPVTDAQTIRAAGFNTVNIDREWGRLENSASPTTFNYNDTSFETLRSQVVAMTNAGLYSVIRLYADYDNIQDHDSLIRFLTAQEWCDSPGTYNTQMSDGFYTTAADSSSGWAHLTQLWLKISGLFLNNTKVIGYDLLNEPSRGCNPIISNDSIRTAWHSRIKELATALREKGDTKILFVEEAPFFTYYGSLLAGVTFKPYEDPRNNWVSSLHWYRGEYKTTSGTWQACYGDYSTLSGYYSNSPPIDASRCSDVGLWVQQAQQAYPNVAFEVGEFGDIYGNVARDINEQWILNSISIFKNNHLAGWAYYGEQTTGTWISDMTSDKQPQPTGSLDPALNYALLAATAVGSAVAALVIIRLIARRTGRQFQDQKVRSHENMSPTAGVEVTGEEFATSR